MNEKEISHPTFLNLTADVLGVRVSESETIRSRAEYRLFAVS